MRFFNQFITFVGCFAALALTAPSVQAEESVNSQDPAITVKMNERLAEITFPDGKVKKVRASLREISEALKLDPIENPSAEFNLSLFESKSKTGAQIARAGGGFGRPIGDYYARISWEYHGYVPCIGDRWHLGFLLKRVRGVPREYEIFNIHIASWRDGGGPQLGVYNSANRWCWRSNIDWGKVNRSIFYAATAVGVSVAAAEIIAAVTTPFIFAALAL